MMAGRGRSNADWLLIVVLAQGLEVKDAAAQAGVSERTAYRRLTDEVFLHQIAEVRLTMMGQAVGEAAAGAGDAVRALRELAKEGSPAIRLQAARELLAASERLQETHPREQTRLRYEASRLRKKPSPMSVEEAYAILVMASWSDPEQLERAWKYVRTRMDSESLSELDAFIESEQARSRWAAGRIAWRTRRGSTAPDDPAASS